MKECLERAARIAAFLKNICGAEKADMGIVLGSGWGETADFLADRRTVSFVDVPGMPVCGVAGHRGNFIFGRAGENRVLAVEGRFHLYEGRDAAETVLPVAVLFSMGAETAVFTNAAGGIREGFRPGDFMLFSDHINMTGKNPLTGASPAPGRPVFADLTEAYDPALRARMKKAAVLAGAVLHEGVYMQVNGPSYETPAEVRAYRAMGADAVGMSTALETVCARWLGMRVCAVSCITNGAAGTGETALSHEDVLSVMRESIGRARTMFSLFCGDGDF